MVNSARGKIKFDKKVIQYEYYKELNDFSHIWILFVFHENTNEFLSVHNKSTKQKSTKAKISPPRMHGLKVGCLSTRSPHRPNPIGLSVCKIISVQDGYIEISGMDMIKGTPILDVKPYIPYDIIPSSIKLPMIESKSNQSTELKVPAWIFEQDIPLRKIIFDPHAFKSLENVVKNKYLTQDYSVDDFVNLITQILVQDIRSVHQGRGVNNSSSGNDKHQENNSSELYELNIDKVTLKFSTFQEYVRIVSLDLLK